MSDDLNYQDVKNIATYLLEKVSVKPKFGIICGSGLGLIGDILQDPVMFSYKDIPCFPISTTEGHSAKLIFGSINNIFVVCFQGRFHYYEGFSLSQCVLPVRLMKALGVTTLIISNAAGSINPLYKTGNIMIIKDHVNLMGLAGCNPLRGSNSDEFGRKFVALNDAYNPPIIKLAKEVVDKLEMKGVQEGVYGCVGGPSYETVAEIKVLKMMGVDAVGMSTVHEIIAARQCDIKCFAFSLITNECVVEYRKEERPDHGDILTVAKGKEEDLKNLIVNLVSQLDKTEF